jgi:hypothetical protein
MARVGSLMYICRNICAMRMLFSNIKTLIVLATISTAACGPTGDHHHDEYTFVMDDVMWLFIILVVIVSLFSCCFFYTDPVYQAPLPPPQAYYCRPCPNQHSQDYRPCPNRPPECVGRDNAIIHIKIDQTDLRRGSDKNKGGGSLTRSQSFSEGKPSAPPQEYTTSSNDDLRPPAP